jgi:cytochrome c oxidase subunit 1
VLGIIVLVVNLVVSIRRGAVAPANPWGGKTLEWQVSSPPPTENFHEIPVVTRGPYDYTSDEQTVAENR